MSIHPALIIVYLIIGAALSTFMIWIQYETFPKIPEEDKGDVLKQVFCYLFLWPILIAVFLVISAISVIWVTIEDSYKRKD